MNKVVITLTILAMVFVGLYQKQKVIILAYELNANKLSLEILEEEKSDILCVFLKETNLASVNRRFAHSGIAMEYPREYVRLVSGIKPESQARPTMLARVLGTSNRAEAHQ